jgi:hypothetical protein
MGIKKIIGILDRSVKNKCFGPIGRRNPPVNREDIREFPAGLINYFI